MRARTAIRAHVRRRRLQRWIRREALLLQREAEQLGCEDATREAERLVEIAHGEAGVIVTARSA